MARLARACVLLLLAVPFVAPGQDDYSFDVSQFEKKAFEWNGHAELRLDRFNLSPGAALYRLNFFDRAEATGLNRVTGAVELSGIYRRGIATFQATAHGEAWRDRLGSQDFLRLYEGYLTLEPDTGARIEAGKRVLRWGKGYAWNPVGFVERPKDPNDPELSREGFVMLAGSLVRSYPGALKNIALTALAVPTRDGVNEDFGAGRHANPAARLSLLYRDTDIDFLYLGEGARSARYGFDFARNLTTNLEIHGEWARITDSLKPVLDAGGTVRREGGPATSYLFGLRYLTERDTTWIVEYYRNGAGYTKQEMRDYFSAVHAAHQRFAATGDALPLERLRGLQNAYARPNAARRYLYVRASQKEPFDILYSTAGATAIVNLDDGSYSLVPEVSYTGITNLELRLRLFFLQGGRLTDFGEKQNDRRIELRARYSF